VRNNALLAITRKPSLAKSLAAGLIVNADDLGIHPNINAGILSAYRRGIVTSCTMLMTTPYFDQTIHDFVRPHALPIGIHLSLTLGKAIAPINEVPDLVDAEGNLKLKAAQLILAAFKGRQGDAVFRQIRREIEAQLALALDHGLRPSHADSQQHVHMNPAIFHLIEELLPRFGIETMRRSREAFHAFVLGPDLLDIVRRNNLAKWALLRWRAAGLHPALATTDDFFGVLYSGAVTKRAMRAMLQVAVPERSLEICVHPGFPAPQGVNIYRQTSNNTFISSSARQTEHNLLVDQDIAELVRERGIALRSFDGVIKA
jgi:chitin disaccharide deacetylase